MRQKGNGIFITLEGSDGSGKSTLARGLQDIMQREQLNAVFTREPGGTPISEKIRNLILDTDQRGMSARCEALLYAASRAEHVEKKIRPALESGKIVVCDRYILSSVAYQGFGRELGSEAIRQINRFATENLEPDLILFLSVDPVSVLNRKSQVVSPDRLEEAGDEFHQRVYEGYCAEIHNEKNKVWIDARQDAEQVLKDAWSSILKFLEETNETLSMYRAR